MGSICCCQDQSKEPELPEQTTKKAISHCNSNSPIDNFDGNNQNNAQEASNADSPNMLAIKGLLQSADPREKIR